MDDKKRRKIEKNKAKLEEWRKSKEETRQMIKKITRPPFRPVGKSTISYEVGCLDRYLEAPKREKSSRHHSKKISSKYTSTPFVKSKCENLPLPFKNDKFSKSPTRRGTFEVKTPMTIPINRTKSQTRSKSVQFQENIIEISANETSELKKSFTPNATHLTTEEVRRLSYAGRTPFSCTSSRSGSTPGRKDFPSNILQKIDNNSVSLEKENIPETPQSINDSKNSKNASSLKKRRSKSYLKFLPHNYYTPKSSIIERDPYPFRRTPVRSKQNSLILADSTILKPKTPKINSECKKSKVVNFGSVVVNEIEPDQSINKTDDKENTINLLKESEAKSLTFENSAKLKNSPLKSSIPQSYQFIPD